MISPMRPNNIQIVAAIGSLLGFMGAHYDRIAATLAALMAVAYTGWKWYKEAKAKRETRHPFKPEPR